MRNRSGLNNFLSQDRRMLYMILSIVLFSTFTLTVVYAALSTTLNISGTAEVSAASWDIYLDNVQLNGNSATANVPTMTDKVTASFSTTLTKPGDFYEFTIDVVNNGSIDAMIDSVTKTPTLTETQTKYLNYVVEYQNGEAITTKQLVSKKSYVRLLVRVEFRKDITASDLPMQSETLDLAFTVNYVQSDDNNDNISIDNNGKLIKIVSGDYDTVGSEICIGQECFYVISSEESSVTMLAKYNLYVGGVYTSFLKAYGDEATGIQDSTMLGYVSGQSSANGATKFSNSDYWGVVSGDTYVYNNNSTLYTYVENYKTYLENQGVGVEEARLIKIEELEALGCSTSLYTCKDAPAWVYATTYWSGSLGVNSSMWYVFSDKDLLRTEFSDKRGIGVRPVITITI